MESGEGCQGEVYTQNHMVSPVVRVPRQYGREGGNRCAINMEE